jgi:hypothetical protein
MAGLAVVSAERTRMRIEMSRVCSFDGAGHGAVEEPAPRGKQTVIRDFADVVVREGEPFARTLEDTAADELFHAFGGGPIGDPGGHRQDCVVEFAPYNRGHGDECLLAPAEPVQPSQDDLLDPLGEWQPVRARWRGAFAQGPHRLDHHERVAFAETPDAAGDPLHIRRDRELTHQREGLHLGERHHIQRELAARGIRLGQEPASQRPVEQLLVPGRGQEEQAPHAPAPGEEGQ